MDPRDESSGLPGEVSTDDAKSEGLLSGEREGVVGGAGVDTGPGVVVVLVKNCQSDEFRLISGAMEEVEGEGDEKEKEPEKEEGGEGESRDEDGDEDEEG